jgi:spore germination protein (amino acid permease)
MVRDTDNLLSIGQFAIILISSMLGVGLLNLPNDVIKLAKQDGWMSCIIGAAYPLYMIFLGSHMCKKFPKENILILSKKCFGKILGTILNFVFIMFFLLLLTEVAGGLCNVSLIYMVNFLSRKKIIATILLVPAFISYKGIKVLGKTSEVLFYVTLPIIFIPIAALNQGSVLNIMPVFSAGAMNILKASKETAFAYSGIEILFLIYPFLQDNKKMKMYSIISATVIGLIYTWITFITIFYLGIETIPKFLWSVVTLTESIIIPVINTFRYVFMFLWSLIMFRTMSNFYYALVYGLSQITKQNSKKLTFLMYPLIFYLSIKYGNPTIRRNFLSEIIPLYVSFNLIYVSTVALLLTIKKGE